MEGAERFLTIFAYLAAAAVIAVGGLTTGFAARDLSSVEIVLMVVVVVPAAFLLIFSLFGLISYFVFIPSVAKDGHLFARVHATQMLHPLITALVLGLLALCIYAGQVVVWIAWAVLLAIYLFQTALIVGRVRTEHLVNGIAGNGKDLGFLLLNLIVGGEVVTLAGGARPLPPWRLHTLPPDTWIVDVRTKPEFYWNRMTAAENYPWGAGLIEAAKEKALDRPVLVTCLSGHRSPAAAVMLRRLGFKTVYNLNWGILYLIVLERGRKNEGPFSLTRAHRDPHRRGEDLKGITVGYVALQGLMLIGAPLEGLLLERSVSTIQTLIGALLGIMGLALAILSFHALGRNFRVYMAPRRSGTLVTRGVYRLIRHPMYTGVIVGFLGYLLLFGSIFLFPLWLAMTILYLIKSVKEEAALADKFPAYEDYCRSSWKFIPYVY